MYESESGRLRYAKPWLFAILIMGFATILLGKIWLFAEAGCKPLQDALLYATVTTMVVLMCFQAIVRRSSPLDQLQRVLWVLLVGLVVPATLGSILSQTPAVKEVFCSQCARAMQNAEYLRTVAKRDPDALAKLDSAEFFVRQCIAQGGSEAREAEVVFAQIQFDKSGVLLENKRCQEAWAAITVAYDVMTKSGRQSDLSLLIEERKKVVQIECARITPSTPLPLSSPTIPAMVITPTIFPSVPTMPPTSTSLTSTSTATPMAIPANGGNSSQATTQVVVAIITSMGSIMAAMLSSAIGAAAALGAVYLREKLRGKKSKNDKSEPRATEEQEE